MRVHSRHAVEDSIARFPYKPDRTSDRRRETLHREFLLHDTGIKVVLAPFGNTGLPEAVREETTNNNPHLRWEACPIIWGVGGMCVTVDWVSRSVSRITATR